MLFYLPFIFCDVINSQPSVNVRHPFACTSHHWNRQIQTLTHTHGCAFLLLAPLQLPPTKHDSTIFLFFPSVCLSIFFRPPPLTRISHPRLSSADTHKPQTYTHTHTERPLQLHPPSAGAVPRRRQHELGESPRAKPCQ